MSKRKIHRTDYIGVYFLPDTRHSSAAKSKKPYRAILSVDTEISCGYYATAREAAIARDKTILRLGIDRPLQILKKKIK